MASYEFKFTGKDDLLCSLRDRFFDIQALVEADNRGPKESDRNLLGQVMLLIREGKEISNWHIQISEDFMELICRAVIRSASLSRTRAEVPQTEALQWCESCDLLCRFLAPVSGGHWAETL
jgi:hypothetical protein